MTGADSRQSLADNQNFWFHTEPKHRAPEPTPGGATADEFVRPFMVSEGRTRPGQDGLRMETMVQADASALSAPVRFEKRRIVELCQRPLSVAEIAACVGVPIGVARVLVADLAEANLVSVAEPTELPTHVIERIRDLVQAL